MRLLNIPHNALVFVGDGRKALFLRNDGNPLHPSLKMEQVHEVENPPTREQGTDRPGRLNSPMGQRNAVETVDWHNLEQHRFARRVAGAMEQLVRARDVKALVVVAPPRTLADLREAFHADVKARIIAEVHKDLTRHPIDEIAQHLTAEH
ncbi:host cell attachment protein [Bradyrhizobium sp. CCBAU 11386]|uniref:host attachment family protein n=1 Tax=Bradyrhizobium sp. CCBAU 11386 TaxID=1630837 RepID=UPI002302163E|nr:host attachment family protein [Bradyrhizobium sp. CCBAU 11386]MDA9504978.1 host cell attachment protein [Bradyrhizobium sp. CCBAU 11386]